MVATVVVRNEYPDGSSTVVMEDCVDKKLDEKHRDIYKHGIETNLNATEMVIEKYPYGHNDNEGRGE